MTAENQPTDQSQAQQEQPVADQAKPLFTVGERSYDVSSAQTKIEHSDNFINTLKDEARQKDAEIEQLKQQLASATKLEEALAKMDQLQPQPTTTQESASTPVVDTEALLAQAEQKALQTVQEQFGMQKMQENQAQSLSAAQQAFGADYEAKLREKAGQLGVNDEYIVNLAQSNPVLFKELFIPKVAQPSSTPSGTVNVGANSTPSFDKDAIRRMSSNVQTYDKGQAKADWESQLKAAEESAKAKGLI